MDVQFGMASASCRRHPHFGAGAAGPRRAALLVAALSFLGSAAPAAAQEAEDLRLRVFRFHRQPDLTLTEVFGVVSLRGLTFTREEAGGQRAAYSGAVEVRDSSGLVLRREEWRGGVTLPVVSPETLERASTSEHFSFSLKPGLYTVVLEVTDSASGVLRRTGAPVRAPERAPPHSDLILASELVRVEEGEESPPGAIRRGTLAIVPNFSGSIPPDQAAVGLFAEIYRPAARETASVAVVIDGKSHAFRHQTAAQTRVYPGGPAVEAFGVDLTGLPPGEYTLTLEARFPSDTMAATHPLAMLPPGSGEMRVAGDLPYPEATLAELDSIWGPMTYLAAPDEAATFLSLGSAAAKRRFIAGFWERRGRALDADPVALREEFEGRVAAANRDFRGRRDVEGWRTDRGKIWITFGPPAERHVEAQRKDQTNPWEVWRYIEGRGDKYVFWDRSGFGEFILVHTTNRDFLGVPGWERYFTDEALTFIQRF